MTPGYPGRSPIRPAGMPWAWDQDARGEPEDRRRPNWVFIPTWVLWSTLSAIANLFVLRFVHCCNLLSPPGLSINSIVTVGGIALVQGLLLGLAQLLVLRKYMTGLHWWVVATTGSWVVMGTLEFVVWTMLRTSIDPYGTNRVVFAVLSDTVGGAIAGGLVGLAQWPALAISTGETPAATKTASWPLVNVLAWGLSSGIVSALIRVSWPWERAPGGGAPVTISLYVLIFTFSSAITASPMLAIMKRAYHNSMLNESVQDGTGTLGTVIDEADRPASTSKKMAILRLMAWLYIAFGCVMGLLYVDAADMHTPRAAGTLDFPPGVSTIFAGWVFPGWQIYAVIVAVAVLAGVFLLTLAWKLERTR